MRTIHEKYDCEEPDKRRKNELKQQMRPIEDAANIQAVPKSHDRKGPDSNDLGKRRAEPNQQPSTTSHAGPKHNSKSLMWKHPFTCLLAGPTQCGKSTFTKRFLKYIYNLVDTQIMQIIYCSPEMSRPDLSDCPVPVIFLDFIPEAEMFKDKKHRVVVIDDMMGECNDQVVDLFTKNSHHLSVSVFFICQNIFHRNKRQRDISLNSHYIVAYKSPRDRAQFAALARQVHPTNVSYLDEIFEDATNDPYGYLLLDLTQTTPEHLRFRTNVFPDDEPTDVVYVPKNFMI